MLFYVRCMLIDTWQIKSLSLSLSLFDGRPYNTLTLPCERVMFIHFQNPAILTSVKSATSVLTLILKQPVPSLFPLSPRCLRLPGGLQRQAI